MTPNLNVRCDYPRHPKTRRLQALLGPLADAYPVRLWAYCGEFSQKHGDFPGYSVAEIEGFAGWTGEPGQLLAALEKVGYMERKKEVWRITDWDEHQGHIYAMKVSNRRAANIRWDRIKKAQKQVSGRNADGNANALHAQCPYPPTVPTSLPDRPRRIGGGGGKVARDGKRTLGTGAPAGWSGKFQWPGPVEVQVPLFHDKAEAMLADCAAIEAEIRKASSDQWGKPVPALQAEAEQALKAWRSRKLDVKKARSA